ncbi:hypothetical protein PAHAL_1G374300, partial [Panicum hallii]
WACVLPSSCCSLKSRSAGALASCSSLSALATRAGRASPERAGGRRAWRWGTSQLEVEPAVCRYLPAPQLGLEACSAPACRSFLRISC